jgi:ADP-heptose:LPS heptosyltransferase
MLALARFSIEALGGSVPTAAPRFDAALTERELELGRELADRHLPRSPRSPVVVHLATPGDVRSWPPDHYRRLTELLLARGRGVLLLSGPGEKDHGHHLRHVLGTRPGLVHWIDQNHPREACAFFTACARRSVPIVASDSGSMHLAAAAGMRVLALCGPQDAARTGPWSAGASSPHVALRAPEEPDCAPCFARVCTHADGPVCMGDLPPELVADAVRDLTTP